MPCRSYLGDRPTYFTHQRTVLPKQLARFKPFQNLSWLAGIGQALADLVQRQHHVFQRLALASEFLRAFGVVPHRRILRQADDLDQPVMFARVVKDTPVVRPPGG